MKLVIIYTDAGGGHKRTAEALRQYLKQRHAWDIKLINIYREALSDIDPCLSLSPYNCEEVYNRYVLQNDRTSFIYWPLLALVYLFMRVLRRKGLYQRILKLWQREKPDLVVSVMPMLNQVMNRALKAYDARVPSVTVITDLAQYLASSWFACAGERVVCGTRKALRQAKQRRYRSNQVIATNGLVIDERFNQPSNRKLKQALMYKHHLNPELPIGLVMYGGYGNPQMCAIAKHLERCRRKLQFIFICGHNRQLYQSMQQLKLSYPAVVLPFIDNVADYLQLSSFVITKPGPGSLMECVSMHKPVITELNLKTLLHERYNAKWLARHEFGFVMRHYRQLPKLVDRLLAPRIYQKIMFQLSQYSNTALQDVGQYLEHVVAHSAVEESELINIHPQQLELLY